MAPSSRQVDPDDPTVVSSRGTPAQDTTVRGDRPLPPADQRPDPDATLPTEGMSVAMPQTDEDTLASQGLYSRGEEIGRGGMGRVSMAWDHNLQRSVAVKEMLPAHQGVAEAGERFLREAFLTGGLEHPGVVPVHHFGVNGEGLPFYTMKYIAGQTLEEAIRGLEELPAPEADYQRLLLLQRAQQACQAIAFAHTQGVIHRDIKPSNIMLGEYGETVVLDWGVAKKIEDASQVPAPCPDEVPPPPGSVPTSGARIPPLPADEQPAPAAPAHSTPPSSGVSGGRAPMGGSSTQAGAVIGTPAYMAPEQARGDVEQLGPSADVFSLGATLYCLVTGRAPYAGIPPDRILEAARTAQFPRPSGLVPTVPRALETIILRAMAQAPADRYGTACELATDLERFLTGQLVEAHQYTLLEKAVNWYRHHRVAVLTMLLLGIATNVVALVVAGLHLTQTLTGTLLWIADAQVRQSLVLTEEWLAPAAGALGLVEDVARRYGTDREPAERALHLLKQSIDNVELVYYAIDDKRHPPVNLGSDPTREFPADVDTRTRPWYTGALAAEGAVAITDPYTEVITGLTCVSVSRHLRLEGNPPADLVVAADIFLMPMIEFLRPRNFPQDGAAVLLSAVDPRAPHPARWQTAKPILIASTLDPAVFDAPMLVTGTIDPTAFDTATQAAAQRMVEAIRAGSRRDATIDVQALLPNLGEAQAVPMTVHAAMLVDLAGRPHAVFTAPVPDVPWEVSVIIPMALLTSPFVDAGRVLLRTSGIGLLIALLGLLLYYAVRTRRDRRLPAVGYAPASTPPHSRT